ncbi:hypothetical protein BOX15_Mlig007879g3 [Macrostomum lignano]|uniref:Deoxynucleoside kinase domain-containing protein n=1 Tax=Macrostomum lignano TaxID=282301 RepID=A0A267DI27_9PLAT|nr:hypothetical protein BOX15_Mlig007879g3 [Macrostomum lignano]
MSFALLRPGILRSCSLGFTQPRCALQLKSKGIQYYWLDHPYEKLHAKPSFYDRPQYHLNENSKSITVEGNIAVGKGTFARHLADVLYLKYIPGVNDDNFFIDRNFEPGLDYRDYNKVLPKRLQFYTTEMLYTDKDPIKDGKPLYLQQNYYMYRCLDYWKGCGHLFNTGQGFVMNRSPFATYVFARAMAECGLLSSDARDWLQYYDKHVSSVLFRPHLIVYLRSPVSLSRRNLDKRAVPWESGITDKFLEVIKQVYESEYLDKATRFSEVTTIDVEDYDFNDENDVTYIAEQLCKIDLDQKHLSTDIDTKLIHWRQAMFNTDSKYFSRMRFSNTRVCIDRLFGIQVPDDMPEGGLTMAEAKRVVTLLKRDPRMHKWSVLNPWDGGSTLDVLLGRVRHNPLRRTYRYDEDTLKEMAMYRSFGYYSRTVEPVYAID